MSRLALAMRSVLTDTSGGELAETLQVPKRTADRWLAELRDRGDLANWPGWAVERIAAFEAATWGTRRIVESLIPDHAVPPQPPADAISVAGSLGQLIESHACNAELIAEMATDVADGDLADHEVRRLLPMVDRGLAAVNGKHTALRALRDSLERRLRHPPAR